MARVTRVASLSDVLVNIARDISTLRASDLLLASISRRVRALLRTDLAYISLNDLDRHETSIRSSDGVRSPAYAAIRMPLGTGVLGLAAGGIVAETPDYLPDEGKIHLPEIDRTVQAEGVRAILASPLRASGRVVGALVVANRTPGAFTDVQRVTLEQVGTLVAAALDLVTAKTAESDARAAAEFATRAGNASIGSARLQEELTSQLALALIEGKQLRTLVEIAAEFAGTPISVRSAAGEDLATAGEPSADSVTAHAALVGQKITGTVVAFGEPAGSNPVVVAQTVAKFASIALQYERTIDDVQNFHNDQLIHGLLSASSETRPNVSAAALHRALGAEGPLSIAALTARSRDETSRRRLLARIRSVAVHHKLIAGSHGRHIVAIGGLAEADLRAALVQSIPEGNYFGGISGALLPSQLLAAYTAASSIESAMRALDRSGVIPGRADAGIAGLLLGDSDRPAATAFVDAHLRPLLDHPRGDILLNTALIYLDTQQTIAKTSGRLDVHPNTVRQRLDRIDSLLGIEWRRGPRSVDTHVALRCWQLSRADHG